MNESRMKESNHVFVCMEKLHSLNYILLNFRVTLMSRWKKCLNHFEKRFTRWSMGKLELAKHLDRAKFHFRIADQKRSR